MKSKIVIISMLLLSCLPTYAGRHSSNLGAAAIGAAAGMFLGAAIANGNSHSSRTYHHTEYVQVPQYRNDYYTERVEVCRPVVETRRYTRPTSVVTTYRTRPSYNEVYYSRGYAPVYQYNECYSTYY